MKLTEDEATAGFQLLAADGRGQMVVLTNNNDRIVRVDAPDGSESYRHERYGCWGWDKAKQHPSWKPTGKRWPTATKAASEKDTLSGIEPEVKII